MRRSHTGKVGECNLRVWNPRTLPSAIKVEGISVMVGVAGGCGIGGKFLKYGRQEVSGPFEQGEGEAGCCEVVGESPLGDEG